MLNITGVSQHIVCQWQGSCFRLWEFAIPDSNAIILKTKTFFWFFFSISGIYLKFQTFLNKRWSWELVYFGNYWLRKTCLEHSLKSTISEDSLTVNMLKRPKLLQKDHESTFIIFFHHYQRTWFGKYLPQLYAKSWGCFLTHCLPMTSILLGIVTICCHRFKCNYLKNERQFQVFFFYFCTLHQILNILKKEMIIIATLFSKLQTVKDLFRPLSKKHRFTTPFDSQHVKGSQALAKGAWEHFHHIFSSPWEKLIWKISPSVLC